MTFTWQGSLDEEGVVRLGEIIALRLKPGIAVALSGDLGVGKSTLARALIRGLAGDDVDVPSPTFSLRQSYAAPRLTVTHFDFYRLGHPEEARELGFDEALQNGAVIVEWPERAASLLPQDRYEIELADTDDPGVRRVSVRGLGAAEPGARRLGAIMNFLGAQPQWRSAVIRYLQGDASTRTYARLSRAGRTMLLMDAPRQPDGPPIRDGLSYSRIAHLAEDMVRPFAAIAPVLASAGLSVPRVLAGDLANGLLLVEDLGDSLFAPEIAKGAPKADLYRHATDALLRLRSLPVPKRMPLPDGSTYSLPRRDRAAFEIEVELLLDWYWPAVKDAPCPEQVRAEFRAVWEPVIGRLLALPGGWFLRDYHSPNLIWLPARDGVAKVGILDFQDALDEHFAFDLVSLLQDARLDIPEDVERELFSRYCARAGEVDARFDRPEFSAAYAMFGAQRNTRLLGLWIRLLRRDGKPHYLQHIPRTWGYLARNLRHPALAPLSAWYDANFTPEQRNPALG